MLTVTSLRNIWLRTCIGNIYLVTSREHLVTYREHLVTYSIYTVGNIWLHLRILFSFYEWYWHLQAFGEIVLKFIYIYIFYDLLIGCLNLKNGKKGYHVSILSSIIAWVNRPFWREFVTLCCHVTDPICYWRLRNSKVAIFYQLQNLGSCRIDLKHKNSKSFKLLQAPLINLLYDLFINQKWVS